MSRVKDILIFIFTTIVISGISYILFLFFYVQKKYEETPNEHNRPMSETKVEEKGINQINKQKNDINWKHLEYFDFQEYQEYKITDTITIDLNGNGVLEQIYFENEECPRLLIKEKGHKTISIGCGRENSKGLPNAVGWVDLWCVVFDKETFEIIIEEGQIVGESIVRIERPSLFIGKQESGGGIITYKNDELYWIHQSD